MDSTIYCIVISATLTSHPRAFLETYRETLSTSHIENIDPATLDDLTPLVDIIERESRRGGLRKIRHNRMRTCPDISISAWPDRDEPLVILTILRPGQALTNEYFNPPPDRVHEAIRIILDVAEQAKVAA